jgi:phage gpG-like protein
MTTIGVELEGMAQLLAQLKALGADADDVVREVVTDLVMDTQAIAIAGIQRSGGGGRTYQKYNPRRTHTASAAGGYPATDTGRLASSVRVIMPTATSLSGEVGTAVKYGAWLEFGTSRMAARPWLLPSFERAKVGVEKELKTRIEGMMK